MMISPLPFSWKPMCWVLAKRTVVRDPTLRSNPTVTPPLNRITASCLSMSVPIPYRSRLPPFPTMAHDSHRGMRRNTSSGGMCARMPATLL